MRNRHVVLMSGIAITAIGFVQAVSDHVAMAAATYQPFATHIDLNGAIVSSPAHIVATDPWASRETSWIPVFYLQQVLGQNGVESTWNGRDLTLIPPANWTVSDSATPQPRALGIQEMDFMVGGKQYEVVPTIVTADPASGVPTTYIPVYYANQFLTKRFSMQTTWDGLYWRLATQDVLVPQAQIDTVLKATTESKYKTEHFAAPQAKQTVVTDGVGGTLAAVVGTRFPTADGYGQLVFFWHNGQFIGTSGTTEASEILSVQPTGPARFTVAYANYKSTDPMVAPSLPPQTVVYSWNGMQMVASDPLQPGVTNQIHVTSPG